MALRPVKNMDDLLDVLRGDTVSKSDLSEQNFLDNILNSVNWKEYDDDTMIFLGSTNLGSNAFKNIIGVFGDLLVASRVPQFSANFAYPLDTRNNNASITGSGLIDYNFNKLRLRTGVTPSSNAVVRSKRFLRYTSGRDAEMMFTAIFTTGVDGTFQYAGLFDEEDGYMLGFKDDKFSIIRRFDGQADEVINQENFNGDKLDGTGISRFVLDPTKLNIYRIAYGYLGTAPVLYQILVPDGESSSQWITFHQINRANKFTDTSVRIPYLPLAVEIDNGITTEDIIVESASVYAGTFDGTGIDRAARYFSAVSTVQSFTGATQERLSVFHNKATFQGLQNHIEAQLLLFTGAVEGNKPVIIEIYKLPDQTNAGGTWEDVDTENSIFEVSEDVPVVVTNKQLLIAMPLGKSESVQIDVEKIFVNLLPGEYAGILITAPSLSDVVAGMSWKELF